MKKDRVPLARFPILQQRLPKERIEILEYEKEERITAMDEKMTGLLFIVRGTIHIYGVEPDGTQYSIVAAQEETILGVVEFLLDRPSPYFAQAASVVWAVFVPFSSTLKQDCELLWLLGQHLATIQLRQSFFDLRRDDLETRIVRYMRWKKEPVTILELLANVHGSRRHVQRALARLKEQGVVTRLKKGLYTWR